MATTFVRRQHGATGKAELNAVGITFTIIITIWTSLVLYGVSLLWVYRGKTAIRIRGFFITASAILSIHAFVSCMFIMYPLNGEFSCTSEFWVMSIIFPGGIAIFQASNIRLMAYATAQRSLFDLHTWTARKQPFTLRPRGFLKWFKQVDYVTRTYFCIGAGLLIQFVVTIILSLGSRRFNPTGGAFGQCVDPATCRRGYEWLPSALWQFLWAWCFGPILLYKTRKIHDTHFWNLQTRLAVLAGMPGTPLWLAFLYINALDNINKYWPPALWFAPCLMMCQATSIIMPLFDIYRHRHNKRPASIISTTSTLVSTISSTSTRKSSKSIATNYEAFEYQLKQDIQPLFHFAATKDFTAENIQFIREVQDFKNRWQAFGASTSDKSLSPTENRAMFEDAARIYFELVCASTSACYINVDSKIYANLEQMFSSVTYESPVDYLTRRHFSVRRLGRSMSTPDKKDESVAPWTSPTTSAITNDNGRLSPFALADLYKRENQVNSNVTTLMTPPFLTEIHSTYSVNLVPLTPTHNAATPFVNDDISLIQYTPPHPSQRGRIVSKTFAEPASTAATFVPTTFSIDVFSKAEDSIKYLVYTNTWKSFVIDMDEDVAARMEEVVRTRQQNRAVSRETTDRGVVLHLGSGESRAVSVIEKGEEYADFGALESRGDGV